MTNIDLSADETYVIARRAYEFALQGAYGQAADLLEGLVAIDPDYGYATTTLAAVRLKQSRASESIALLEPYRRKDPRDEQAGLLLVEAYVELRRLAEADRLLAELRTFGVEAPERLSLRLLAARHNGGQSRIAN